MCAACPVTRACLAAAMAEERLEAYRYGVRGGTSAAERDRLAEPYVGVAA